MSKRRTKDSLVALEIYEEIKDIQGSFLKEYTVENPHVVAEGIRRNIRFKGSAQPIAITEKGNTLFVGSKSNSRRTYRLEKLVRNMLNHVDDDKLHDEAMEVLYGV